MDTPLIELNDLNFDKEVLDAWSPVLVQFWARWSASSHAMTLMLNSIPGAVSAPVKIGRVNVEDNEAIAERFGVRAVPTLLIFNEGALQYQVIGAVTEGDVRERLARLRQPRH